MTKCWNHNVHYHPVLLGQLPAGAGDALDVGSGTGMLTRQLRERIPHVTGIDRHPPSIARFPRSGRWHTGPMPAGDHLAPAECPVRADREPARALVRGRAWHQLLLISSSCTRGH